MMVTFLLGVGAITAQNIQSIILKDAQTTTPISNATYTYGNQKGTSDPEGKIEIDYMAGETLRLSHILYGQWQLSSDQVLEALASGEISQKSQSVDLHPVTVIALRPSAQINQKLTLEENDYLSHDATAILMATPEFGAIRKGGNYGFDPVFRGFKYDQLNIVLNGAQSATAACPNRMDPPTSQMAPNMMDRVEVLKGPHALRYGTGFGATINFVPAGLHFTEEPDVYGRLTSGYESNGQIARGEGQIGLSGRNYDLGIFASWSQGNDYSAGNGQTVQSDFVRGSFGTQLGLKLGDRQEIRLSGLYNMARDADFPALPMDLREDDTWMFNARHDIAFVRGPLTSWNTTVFGSFVDHLMDNLLKPLDPRMMNARTDATTQNYGARTEGIWRLPKGKLYTGLDYRLEGAEGLRTRDFLLGPNAGKTAIDNAWQEGQIQKAGLFTEYHFHLNTLHFIASGRLEYNQAEVLDPTAEFVEVNPETEITQWNPSVSIGFNRPMGQFNLGLWLGRAQRSGSLTERYINYFPVGQDPFEMLGNPEIRPEINNQVDLSMQWANERSNIKVDLFAAYLQDYITSFILDDVAPRLPMSPGVRQFENIDNAMKAGLEVSWTQSLPYGLGHTFALAYTYGQDLERETPLPEIAPLDARYSLNGSYWSDRLQPFISIRHVLAQERVAEAFGETNTPAFTLLDLGVSYQILSNLKLTAGVNNLLDENYYEHLNRSVRGSMDPIFAPGRNYQASVNFTF